MLNVLGSFFSKKSEWTGAVDDFEQAIQASEAAVAASPPNHPSQATRLVILGDTLHTRFLQLGDLNDLENAILVGKRAVSSMPQDHPDRANTLNFLIDVLDRRYLRLGVLDDLAQAIQVSEQAVRSIRLDHSAFAGILGVMSTLLYNKSTAETDLEKSTKVLQQVIEAGEKAVTATLLDDPARCTRLTSLSCLFHTMFERSGSLGELEKAVTISEEAVSATPLDHPDRALIQLLLSCVLSSRYPLTKSQTDFQGSVDIGLDSWNCYMSPPWIRIRAARHTTNLLASALKYKVILNNPPYKLSIPWHPKLQPAFPVLHRFSPISLHKYAPIRVASIADPD